MTGLRDELKTVNTHISKAEADKRNDDAKKLKDLRITKRKMLWNAAFNAVKNGHHGILEVLGNSQKLVNSLVSVLIDCIKMEDYDGELPRAILKLLAQFNTLTDEFLQRVKFDAVEKRFNKKGDAEIKGFIANIRSKTVEGKQKLQVAKEEADKLEKSKAPLINAQETSKVPKAEDSSKTATVPSGLKRSHEADTDSSNGKPPKKIASDATAVVSNHKNPAAKTRPANFFASLKRPGVKPTAKPATSATPAAAVKKPETKVEPARAAPQQSSMLAGLLASIEKPREVPKPVEAPTGPPETDEEKAKRLRKESRRHLRVRWKDGEALVQIKLFKHDQEEDEGRQDNMLRDAHDDRSEGMMLKQRLQETITDEEDDSPEVEYLPYPDELLAIDFSAMDGREKNFITRGGEVSFTTPQKEIQEKREAVELMVVYTDPKDIPLSPKEPPQAVVNDPQEPERMLGQPTADWLLQRLQEIQKFGWNTAMSISVHRLEGHLKRSHEAALQNSASAPTQDITSILNAMKGGPPDQSSISSSHHLLAQTSTNYIEKRMDPTELDSLLRAIKPLIGKSFPPVEPPEWMNQRLKQMWWDGYNRDNGINEAAAKRAIEDAAAQMHANQMQYPPASYAPPPPTMTANHVSAYDDSQLQSIIAGLHNPNNQPQSQQPQNWYGGYSNQGQNQTQAYNSQDQQFDTPKYGTTAAPVIRDPQSLWDNNDNGWKDNKRRGDNSNDHHNRGRSDGGKELDPRFPGEKRRGKKPCKFWGDGKCAKGDQCGYCK
jgi:hypothetical protein